MSVASARGVETTGRNYGDTRTAERTLPLAGYRDSRPVRIGNGARNGVQQLTARAKDRAASVAQQAQP